MLVGSWYDAGCGDDDLKSALIAAKEKLDESSLTPKHMTSPWMAMATVHGRSIAVTGARSRQGSQLSTGDSKVVSMASECTNQTILWTLVRNKKQGQILAGRTSRKTTVQSQPFHFFELLSGRRHASAIGPGHWSTGGSGKDPSLPRPIQKSRTATRLDASTEASHTSFRHPVTPHMPT